MSYLSPADWPDAELVQFIREVASHELKQEYGFPFFWADYEPDESPDTALIRMFQQEWGNGKTPYHIVLVLCHG